MPFLIQIGQTFFSIKVFCHWQFTGQQGKEGDHRLFHCTTSTRSWTLIHLFATFHVRWLSRIFNHNACVYQSVTRWDLPPYRITIWLIDWLMKQCLFVYLMNWFYVFVTAILTLETGRFELTSTITLVLQANRLTKCASVALTCFKFGISSYNCYKFLLRLFYNHYFLL